MKPRLVVANYLYREAFTLTDYIEKDDIFMLVREGSFTFEREGERFIVHENEGALFRKNVFYHRQVITPVKIYLFRYKSETPVFPTDHIVFQDSGRVRSTMDLLDRLKSEIYKNEFDFFIHFFEDLIAQYRIENNQNPKTDPIIEKAIYRMKREVHQGIDLYALAKESGFSYVHFLRRFKNYTGMTPSEYVISLRLQKAKTLLLESDLMIREISVACGFENEYYFSNFFKKHTSHAPSSFRALSK